MGFFSRLSGHIRDLDNMSIAVGNVVSILNKYDTTEDFELLAIAAWLCKVGVRDIMLTGEMSPVYNINVIIDKHIKKMKVYEDLNISVGRLTMITEELSEDNKHYILDIFNGGDSFVEFDSMLSQEQKNKLLKTSIISN